MKKQWLTSLIIACAVAAGVPATTVQAAEFPKKYRTEEVTPAKNQGSDGLCWAFAAASAMETELIKNNGADEELDLSELQIGCFRFNQPMDPLGQNTMMFSGTNDVIGGGRNFVTIGLLGTGMSPIEEEDCPVVYEDITDATRLDDSLAFTGQYYLKEAIIMSEPSRNEIKDAVQKYGSVAIDFYTDESNYNEETYAWYNPNASGINHVVCIVGWDDGYSKKNFKTTPKGNGAWIVKNSWGDDWGDDGFFYVSYYDTSFLHPRTDVTAFDMEPGSFADNIYKNAFTATQYLGKKENGETDWSGYNGSADKVANVFTAQANEGGAEALTGVSFYTFEKADYEIKIYKNVKQSNKPEGGTLAATLKGRVDIPGFQIIPLETSVYLSEGESYSIVADLINDKGKHCGVVQSDNSQVEVTPTYYQSYQYSAGAGTWRDVALYGYNYYLNGYTENVKKNTKEDAKKVTMKQVSDNLDRYNIPDAVTGLKVDYTDSTSVVLSWDRVEGMEYLICLYNAEAGTWKKLEYAKSGKDYHKITGLTPGKTYTFGVKSVGNRGNSEKDRVYFQSLECVSVETKTASAKQITPTVTAGKNGNTVKWSKVSGATKYIIYVNSPETDYTWQKLKTVTSGSSLKYTDKNVVKGLTYYYRVYAYKDSERMSRGIPVGIVFE